MLAKNISKKVLSLFMTLVMLLGLMPTTALAAGPAANPNPDVTVAHNGTKVEASDEDTSITGQKTIAKVPGKQDEFDITLKVTTVSTSTTTLEGKPIHVVLVLDTSGSMKDENRMSSAKDAAKAFVNTILGADGIPGSQVGLVTYAASASKKSDLTNNNSNLLTAINNIGTPSGGTNIQAGLYEAQKILDADDTPNVTKMIILLSDGQPTYSYRLTGTGNASWSFLNGYYNFRDINITGRDTSTTLGDGNNYEISWYNNLSLTLTNQDNDKTTIKYGSSGVITSGNANNGYATIWEAGQAKGKGTEIYSIMLKGNNTAKGVMKDISTNPNTHYKSAENVSELESIFKAIANTVNNEASGSILIDPMSDYVTAIPESVKSKGETPNAGEATWNADNSILSWDLSKAKKTVATKEVNQVTTTTTTYTLTYRITVNPTEAFYQVVKDSNGQGVPTNKATTLPYTLGDDSGTLNLDVPRVTSVIPTLNYTIEFYKQGTAQKGSYTNYQAQGNHTITGVAELFTLINPPSGYGNKYNSDNYSFAAGDPAAISISLAGPNVIKLYYDRDTANVTVNHFYRLTTINSDGSTTIGEYPLTPQDSVSVFPAPYVSDSYIAEERLTWGGVTYELDSEKPNHKTITVDADGTKNVINLYYVQEIDNRKDVDFSVDHVYRTHTWTLENGTYVLKDFSETVANVQSGTQKAHTIYTVTDLAPKPGKEDFTYDRNSVNSITLTEAGPNKITLYFDKTVDDRISIPVTVNHHYTKTTKSIDENGSITTTVDPDNHIETVSVSDKYVGERFIATEMNTYGGEGYTSDSGNAAKLTVTSLNTNNSVINLYYTILEEPAKTTVTVNHIYRTITQETVVKKDAEDNIIGTEIVVHTQEDDRESLASDPLYVGEFYQPPVVGRDSYTFNEGDSIPRSVYAASDGESVINLYYDKGTTSDDREEATIDVRHIYTTHLTTIVDGAVNVQDVVTGDVLDLPHTGKAGDSFTAEEMTTYNGETYTVVGSPVLTKILHSGANSTIEIHYERNDSDLVETNYTVDYVYKTHTMTVENGVAGYYDDPAIENGTQVTNTGDVYVGQIVNIPDGAKSGFDPKGINPATSQTLKKEDNAWTFTYAKYVPLATVTVTVNHHYTTTTIAVNGTPTVTTSDTLGTPVDKHAGETFVAVASLNGFDFDRYTVTQGIEATQDDATKNVTVTAGGNVVVDFYYTKTIDNSKPTTYSIQHIYKTIDWDNTVMTSTPDPITGTGFATNSISATPDPNGYTLVSATYNDDTLEEPYSITLVEGENVVVFAYEKRIDTRVDTKVKVIHEYYKKSAITNAEVFEFATDSVIAGKENHVWVGNSYEATQVPSYNDVVYTFISADPSLTIDSLLAVPDGGTTTNVITLKYVRTYTPGPNTDTKVEIPVTKQWVGPVGADSITVGLFRTTTANVPVLLTVETPVAKVTLTKDGGWEGTFGEWPTQDLEGNSYDYSVKEQDGEGWAGSTSKITFDSHIYYDIHIEKIENGFHVTNTIEPGSLDIRGEKLWANVSGITLPNEVTVRLYADGEPANRESQTLEGNSETSWHFSFSELPRYARDGHEIVYTVKEAGEDANRRVTINGNTFQVSGGTKRTVIIEDESVEVYDLTNTYLTPNVPGPDPDPDPTPTPTPTPPETDIPDEETPLGPTIPDEETPLAPAPQPEPVIDDAEILEEVVPMGNLPQTGTAGLAVDPTVTLGALAVCLSMATAGLAIIVTGRKKKEDGEN